MGESYPQREFGLVKLTNLEIFAKLSDDTGEFC
jgi:hypothetical protein